MPERDWSIEEQWEPGYELDDDEAVEVSEDDEDTLALALEEATSVLRRIGGIIQVAAIRREIAPGMWEMQGYQFRWNSYVPGQRNEETPPKAQRGKPPRRRRPQQESAVDDGVVEEPAAVAAQNGNGDEAYDPED